MRKLPKYDPLHPVTHPLFGQQELILFSPPPPFGSPILSKRDHLRAQPKD